jgi:hypothetical protein
MIILCACNSGGKDTRPITLPFDLDFFLYVFGKHDNLGLTAPLPSNRGLKEDTPTQTL